MKKFARTLPLFIGLILSTVVASAQDQWGDQGWKAVGVRGGISATEKDEYFHRYDVFALYGLPWSLRGHSGWGAAMALNMSGGILRGGDASGFIAGAGPTVMVDKGGHRGVLFELGGAIVGLSRRHFGKQDFHGNFLFQGHTGLAYRFDSGLGIGYQFHHVSNGGIYGRGNPGVDLHMIALSWNM